MEPATPKELFLQSLKRCKHGEFLKAFYDRFLASSPAVRRKFRSTDFAQQKQMLMRSLELSALSTVGNPEALRDLRQRAESHSKRRLNIPPEMYDLWLDAIVQTAAEFDPQWNEATEDAWRGILGHVIEHMVKYYDA